MTKAFCPTVQERINVAPKNLRLADAINVADCELKKSPRALITYLDKVRSDFELEADALYLAKFHLYYGMGLRRLGNFQGALDEAETALYLYEGAGDQLRVGIANNNIGNAYIGLEKIPEAHEHLDLAEKRFIEFGNNDCLGANLECRARALLHQGDCISALKTACRSLSLLADSIENTPRKESLKTVNLCELGLDIKNALEMAGGSVPQAAKLLKYTDRQALDYQLKTHFPFFESLGLVKRRGK